MIEELQSQLPKVNTRSTVVIKDGLMDRLKKLHHPDTKQLFVGQGSLWREPQKGKLWWKFLDFFMPALTKQREAQGDGVLQPGWSSLCKVDSVSFENMKRAEPRFF